MKLIRPLLLTLFLVVVSSHSNAQVFVKVKPNHPAKVAARPAQAKPNHVWIDGHWKYDERQQKYVWIDGHWVKENKGHNWVPGHWQSKDGGFVWVPGHWQKHDPHHKPAKPPKRPKK